MIVLPSSWNTFWQIMSTMVITTPIPIQSSLPERHNPPGFDFDALPHCAPSENHMVTITIINIIIIVVIAIVVFVVGVVIVVMVTRGQHDCHDHGQDEDDCHDRDDDDEDVQVRDVADRQRRLKPITPTKPSTLSFRFSLSSLSFYQFMYNG